MQSSNLFFASNPGVPQFWDRKFSNMPTQIQHALKEDMDEPVTLLKIGHILSRTVARGYKTLEQYLFYFGEVLCQLIENGNLKGFTNLKNVYLKITSRKPTQELQYEKQIILRKDQRQLILYFNKSQAMKIFLSRLETMCILDSFESKFRILELIGEGSSAQVYLAECMKDQQVYAVKSIAKQQSSVKYLEYRVNALLEEIQIMRSLNHPNLMGLFYVYETESHIQLVMQYYSGGTLLEKLGEMNINNKMKFSQELLETVFYMHQQGIMHRDLKPQNIIYKSKEQKNFQFVIGDFGFATRTKQVNHVLYKCGTLGYVAPEILEYKDKQRMYNAQCDVYSLGVIMYQIFFKCQPFKSKCNDTILNSISCTFDDTVEVPNTLKILLISMLRKDPRDRFSIKQCLEHDFFKENIQNDFQDEQQSFKVVSSLANLIREKRCKTVAQRKHSIEKGNRQEVLSEEQEITQEPKIQYQRRLTVKQYRQSVGSTNDSKFHKVTFFQDLKKKNKTIVDTHFNDLLFEEDHQIPINFGIIRLGKKS